MDKTEVFKSMINLCIKHKKLLSLSEFSKEIGISRKLLRDKIGNKEYIDKLLKSYLSFDKKGNLLSNELKKDIDNYHKELLENENILLHKENTKLKQEIKNKKHTDALEDKILNIITDYVKAFPNYYTPVKIKKDKFTIPYLNRGKREAILALSDFHGFEKISIEEMGGLNEYNVKIMIKRFQYIIDYILHEFSKYNNIDKINIFLLGDFVSGDIHEELSVTNEDNIVEATFGVASLLTQGLLDIAKNMNKVKVFCVVGNHGRLNKKKTYKEKYVNWDYVIYKILQTTLKNQKNIEFVVPKSFFLVTQILNHNFLLLHGDDIRSWASIPWYGITRTVTKLSDVLKYTQVNRIDYTFLAHFHNTSQLDNNFGEIIINSSLCGTDEFALGRLFTVSKPKQTFCLVNEFDGLTWRIPIDLTRAHTVIKDSNIRYSI